MINMYAVGSKKNIYTLDNSSTPPSCKITKALSDAISRELAEFTKEIDACVRSNSKQHSNSE